MVRSGGRRMRGGSGCRLPCVDGSPGSAPVRTRQTPVTVSPARHVIFFLNMGVVTTPVRIARWRGARPGTQHDVPSSVRPKHHHRLSNPSRGWHHGGSRRPAARPDRPMGASRALRLPGDRTTGQSHGWTLNDHSLGLANAFGAVAARSVPDTHVLRAVLATPASEIAVICPASSADGSGSAENRPRSWRVRPDAQIGVVPKRGSGSDRRRIRGPAGDRGRRTGPPSFDPGEGPPVPVSTNVHMESHLSGLNQQESE